MKHESLRLAARSLAEGRTHCTRPLCCLSACLRVLRIDGRSGLPLIAPPNPGHLLHQTNLTGQGETADDKKVSWVRAVYKKTGSAAEKDDSWESCIGCGEARSTRNVIRLKDHLMVLMKYLLSATASTCQAVTFESAESNLVINRADSRKILACGALL